MPDKPRNGAISMIRGIVGAETSDDFTKNALIVPVSVSVYNALHDSDKDFERVLLSPKKGGNRD
jgi:hypothetical protein